MSASYSTGRHFLTVIEYGLGRYQVGLDKISRAEDQVAELQQDLVAMKPVLEQTSKEVLLSAAILGLNVLGVGGRDDGGY